MPDAPLYRARRQRLIDTMGAGIALIPTAPERIRNADTPYPYRPDSSFYYLSGFDEPEAVIALIGGDTPKQILFCRQKDETREIWEGFRYGPKAAQEAFGFDEAYVVDDFTARLPELLADQPTLWYPLGDDADFDRRMLDALGQARSAKRSALAAPQDLRDIRMLVHEMRLVKDAHEQALMARSGEIAAAAHVRAMRFARPGRFEYEVEAEILHDFYRSGAAYPAYPSIVAGGANACVLHYVSNRATLRDGDLLLIDAGCEYQGYAADITRTFPVNGRYSGPQRDVYQIVLDAQFAAIATVRPGASFNDAHDAALRVLAQGLVDLKLCEGSVDAVIDSGTYKRFYMHKTGHWLGMDVHDCGEYRIDGDWRRLQAGMAVTVEPGLYIRPADDVPEAFWNIGIRIEDDVIVTETGHRVLTHGVPKTIADIEAVMAEQADA